MGMYTWLDENEFEKYKTLSDKDLNELLQEVRQIMPDIYVQEKNIIIKRLIRSNKIITQYNVYHRSVGTEVRCLNLNFSSNSHLFNYLCGLINGYNRKPFNKKSKYTTTPVK